MARLVRLLWAVTLALLTTGCATQTRQLSATASGLPVRYELADTPFFAQDRHQCGPASLATALSAAGYSADPQQLETQVFVPALAGSLQADMLAAARRRGALGLPVAESLLGLFAEVANGTPVIVLQNLGLSIAPRWHYAVVIGFDLPAREVILRSGVNRRDVMSMSTFEHTWARSNYWGMLIPRPGRLPLSADRSMLEKTLSQLEKYAEPDSMLAWYRQATERWPDSLIFMIGLGHAAYTRGQLEDAEQAFRTASQRHPQSVAALNNLAIVLQKRGQLDEALVVAEQAVALGGEWLPAAQATRDDIAMAIRNPSTSNATD